MQQSSNFQATARAWRKAESLRIIEEAASPLVNMKENSQVEVVAPVTALHVAATAHHLDDQVETSLLKLLRGVHLSHLHPVRSCVMLV